MWPLLAIGGGLGIALTVVLLAPTDDHAGPAPTTTFPGGQSPTTTASPDPAAAFVISFRVAIDAEDVAFLMERLHPVVIDAYGSEACRAFVTQEILELRNYRQTGDSIGPIIRAFTTTEGSVTAQTYEVPVAFEFQGQDHRDRALLGFSDDTMHWFAECR